MLTYSQQLDAVTDQIAAAQQGVPLPALASEAVDPTFWTRPLVPAGAYLRVAYWLATAARPRVQGAAPNMRLLQMAHRAQGQAARAEASEAWFDLTSLFTSTESQITRILYDGEEAAAQAGRPDVASQLHAMRTAQGANLGDINLTTTSGRTQAGVVLGGSTAAGLVTGAALIAAVATAPLWIPAATLAFTNAADRVTRR